MNTLTRSLLSVAVAATLAACGGGGGYGGDDNNNPPPPPPVTLADGQFVLERFEGLGVSSNGANDAATDAAGKFKFAVGQDVRLFVGQGANKLTIGTVTPTAVNGGVAPVGLQDLKEVQNDNDQVLGNILVLLRALDADGDPTNGVKIDAAANAAIAKAVAGGKTVNFNQAAAAFAADPVIVAVLAELKRQLADAKAALIDFTELFPQSRSSSIALTSDDTRLVVVNRQKASASVFRVRAANGADVNEPPVEVTVGKEPRYVAITPDNKRALVTNTIEGSVSVIDLAAATAGRGRRADQRRRRAARHRDHAERHVCVRRQLHDRRSDGDPPVDAGGRALDQDRRQSAGGRDHQRRRQERSATSGST